MMFATVFRSMFVCYAFVDVLRGYEGLVTSATGLCNRDAVLDVFLTLTQSEGCCKFLSYVIKISNTLLCMFCLFSVFLRVAIR